MNRNLSRRRMLATTGTAAAATILAPPFCFSAEKKTESSPAGGAVIGEETGAAVGEHVLAEGGNAVDAAVAAALTACVATPSRCGIAGYGGHMTLFIAKSRRVVSIDFNSTAPAAARADMYPLDEKGEVKGRVNFYGWLAAGVPGTLAGLQLVLDRYGTRPLSELLKPAIQIAEKGFLINTVFAATLKGAAARFRQDPGSARLYLRNGEPPGIGELLPNPDLAAVLSTLAARNSVESFYRGDIAQRMAEAFSKNGGLVTGKDLADYRAHEVEPLKLAWGDFSIFTAPLTAGGLTVIEALTILKAIRWDADPASPPNTHARLEALRLAWKDRLELLGDPEKASVPVKKLLSADYASELGAKIKAAVAGKRPVEIQLKRRVEDGTNHLSSVDRLGNLVAVTLTHGAGFGAQVTADGLGLTFGHGMSRFDPHPESPNAPGPGKRPLHNMCPSVILRDGKPGLAAGGAGGVKIPNALYDVLSNYVARRATMEAAIAAPRMHTTGTLDVTLDRAWPAEHSAYLKEIGFQVHDGEGARVSAVSFDSRTGECRKAAR